MEKTLEEAKELLNSILLTDNTPILFLGAGFSCGASNKANAMDGCKLKEYIYDTLAKDKIGPEDEEEVKGYDLRKLSDEIYRIYHGKTEFRGIYQGDILELTPFQKQTFKVDTVSQLYPEYYILKVNGFNQIAKSPLEEWIYYLNTGEIPSSATVLELEEARERLKLDSMTKDELVAYYRHLDNIVILHDNIYTEREEGRAEGREEANWDNARNLKKTGSSY